MGFLTFCRASGAVQILSLLATNANVSAKVTAKIQSSFRTTSVANSSYAHAVELKPDPVLRVHLSVPRCSGCQMKPPGRIARNRAECTGIETDDISARCRDDFHVPPSAVDAPIVRLIPAGCDADAVFFQFRSARRDSCYRICQQWRPIEISTAVIC